MIGKNSLQPASELHSGPRYAQLRREHTYAYDCALSSPRVPSKRWKAFRSKPRTLHFDVVMMDAARGASCRRASSPKKFPLSYCITVALSLTALAVPSSRM